MIHLAHVANAEAARRWLALRSLEIHDNPVPLLVVTMTVPAQRVQGLLQEISIGGFILDASGQTVATADQNVMLITPQRLDEAERFIAHARESRRRLDILVIDASAVPDLRWCQHHVQTFERLV